MGLKIEGRISAREGAEIVTEDGIQIGQVSSGGFGPTIGSPVALAFVQKNSQKSARNYKQWCVIKNYQQLFVSCLLFLKAIIESKRFIQ